MDNGVDQIFLERPRALKGLVRPIADQALKRLEPDEILRSEHGGVTVYRRMFRISRTVNL